MSHPLRTKQIRATILEALKYAGGYALPEASLRSHVNGLLRPPCTDEEWAGSTEWLAAEGHTVRVPSDLDAALVQWAITERGRTLLSTL